MATFNQLVNDESAQGMTEYAVLVGTLVLGTIVTLMTISTKLQTIFNAVDTELNTVPTS